MDNKDFEEKEMDFIKKSFNEKKIADTRIDESKCVELIKEAIKASIPKVKEEAEDETVLGLSFEITNTVDLNAFFDYGFNVHFLTNEILEHCENPYDTCYTWENIESETESSSTLTDYLLENITPYADSICKSFDEMTEEEKEAAEWYENEFDATYERRDDECALIRKCVALAVGELNKEKFFSNQFGSITVYPYDGDLMLEKEELLEHFKLMQNEENDECFIDYLNDVKEEE